MNHVVVEGTPSPRDSVDARVKARDSNARRAPSRGVVHVDTRAVLRAGGGDEPERPAVPAVSAERATGGDVEKLSVRLTRLGSREKPGLDARHAPGRRGIVRAGGGHVAPGLVLLRAPRAGGHLR